jgi:hypothetical protein
MRKKKDKADRRPATDFGSKQVSKNVSKGIRWWALLLLIIIIAAIAGYFVFSKSEKTEVIAEHSKKAEGPTFNKEGTLAFIKQGSQDTVRIIDIEIAETPDERSQGMMFRSSMSDSVGMLFIFESSKEQTFWMKNTKLSLDILFADENFQIVTIYKYTTPYSEASLPSFKEAKYVVEVSGGFTNRYNITEGDKIAFERVTAADPT